MANLKKELDAKLEKIMRIYILAQDAYFYTEYFHNPETQQELDFITKSPHASNIQFIMHLMFRSLITELAKLYRNTDQERYSIISFLESLSPLRHFGKISVSIEHINEWKTSINNNQSIISNVLILRDKVYAHTDNPLKSYSNIEISFKDIKALLDLAAGLLRAIYRDILDIDFRLESPSFDRQRFGILKLLAKAEEQRVNEIFEKYSQSNK